ncbi:MAG: DUF5700 domain-containing putative Zn-dependent protease [Parasphingorhabdus sp.]
MYRILIILALIACALPARAQTIDIDISNANRLLEIACSNQAIDPLEFSTSSIVQKQVEHHREFAERFTMENYLKGLEAAAHCKVLEKDPYRFRYLVQQRPSMTKSISYLLTKRADLTNRVRSNIAPYLPEGFDFESKVIIVAASFSCGGFSKDELFYIDLPCLSADIEGEYEAIAKLISHEAYHAMQNAFASKPMVDEKDVRTELQAWDFMFHRLAIEGSAAFVGDMRNINGDGRYAKFSRNLAQRNFRQLSYNFDLLAFMMEAVAHDPDSLAKRFPKIYALAFDGGFGEPSYFVGQQMTAEIVHSFGPETLPCLLALPPEEFALGYHKAMADDDNLIKSEALAPSIVEIANRLKVSRSTSHNKEICTKS